MPEPAASDSRGASTAKLSMPMVMQEKRLGVQCILPLSSDSDMSSKGGNGSAQEGTDSASQAKPEKSLAESCGEAARFAEVAPLYRRAIQDVQRDYPNAYQKLATLYGNLGVCERQAGNYGSAERAFQQGLRTLSDNPKMDQKRVHRLAWLNFNLGTLYHAQKHYDKAQSQFKAVWDLLDRPGPKDPLIVNLAGEMASLYRSLGDYRLSELFFERALDYANANLGILPVVKARLLTGMGSLYRLLADYPKAEEHFAEALAVLPSPKRNAVELADIFHNIGELRKGQRRWSEALTCLENGRQILRARYRAGHPKLLAAQHNLADLHYRSGNLRDAEELFRGVLARRKDMAPASLDVADTLNSLAGVAWARGNSEESQRLLEQALAIRTKGLPAGHPDLALSWVNLAVNHAGSGRYSESMDAFARASVMDKGLLDHVIGFATEEQKLHYLTKKSRHLHALFSLVSRELAQNEEAVRLAAEAWLTRKGMLLEARRRYQSVLAGRDSPRAVELLKELGKLRREHSEMIHGKDGVQPTDSHRKSLAELEERIAEQERELARESPAYGEEKALLRADVSSIASRLPANSVLVDFARFERFVFSEQDPRKRWGGAEYLAFVIDSTGGVQIVPLGAADGIEERIGGLLSRLTHKTHLNQSGYQDLHWLYQKVFRPLEKHFPGHVQEVLLSPDGALNLIPFEIFLSEDERFLTQRYLFTYLSTGRDLMRRPSGSLNEGGEILLLGDPDYDHAGGGMEPDRDCDQDARVRWGATGRGAWASEAESGAEAEAEGWGGHYWGRLSGTCKEVKAISKLLKEQRPKVYMGASATEEVVSSLHRPRQLHFATHGFFFGNALAPEGGVEESGTPARIPAENPMLRSGLALAGANRVDLTEESRQDGILTALEVLGIDLRGTDLAVLSACETGRGGVVEGEGVYGLRRAFSVAGAESVVMSLWQVPDGSTKDLMEKFYAAMIEDRLSPGPALRKARNSMIQEIEERYGHPSPHYWGAFIYQGLPQIGESQR